MANTYPTTYEPGTIFEDEGITYVVVMSWYEPYSASHQNGDDTMWWRFVAKRPRGKLYYAGNLYPGRNRVVATHGYRA